jgi:hypothetical protein
MTLSTLVLRPLFARRIPDPVFAEITHHTFFVPAHTLIDGISYGPNARRPNTKKQVYKKVESSLRNEDCIPNTFHLKNLGIVINAAAVTRISDHEYHIELPDHEQHGVLNGGHTLDLIVKNLKEEAIKGQFVKIEVRTGVAEAWLAEIAGGLNTALQVEDMSLDDLAGAFDWIKEELRGEPYYKDIAWSENDNGAYDARDIVSLLTCVHIGLYPNSTSGSHPVEAYEKKSKALDAFRDDYENGGHEFRKLRPLLKDLLRLHDIIRQDFAVVHNKNGGKAGHLKIMDTKDDKAKSEFLFFFTGKKGKIRLQTGALYPILAAFRWMVEEGEDGNFRWRGGFDAVLKRWKDVGPDLVRKTFERSKELGGNSNAIGKSRTHWETLHQSVAFRDLMANQVVPAS